MPPQSSDCNPIELLFSSVKSRLKNKIIDTKFEDNFVRNVSRSFFKTTENDFLGFYKYSVRAWVKALEMENVWFDYIYKYIFVMI